MLHQHVIDRRWALKVGVPEVARSGRAASTDGANAIALPPPCLVRPLETSSASFLNASAGGRVVTHAAGVGPRREHRPAACQKAQLLEDEVDQLGLKRAAKVALAATVQSTV